MFKKVKLLLPAETVDMGGFPVRQPLPTIKVDQVDPFLLLHHASVKPLKDRPARIQGVGPHPHRGFSRVTFVIEGSVHHRDSRGNSQIARSGEVQWMHAGMGIIHSERPSEDLVEAHARQEIIQLWINSPAKSKMKQPEYSFLAKESMVIFPSDEGKVANSLISGAYGSLNGPIHGESPLLVIWSSGKEGGKQDFNIPAGFNCCLYVIRGKLNIEGYGMVEKENLVVFEEEGEETGIRLLEDSQFLLLAGMPIGEKVVQQGPFVMNSETQIMEAMRDYQMGKMGILIEEDL